MTISTTELAQKAEPLVRRMAAACSSASLAASAHDMDRERWMDCSLGIAEELVDVVHDLCDLMGSRPASRHLDSVLDAVDDLSFDKLPAPLHRATDYASRTALAFAMAVEDGVRGDTPDYDALAGFGAEGFAWSDLALRWATGGTVAARRERGVLKFEFTEVGKAQAFAPIKQKTRQGESA